MKITEIQKIRYTTRLEELKKDEPALGEQVTIALGLGDTSENSELDSAKAELSTNKIEQSRITEILESSEIVSYNSSSIITEGSMIKLNSPSLDGEMVLLLSDVGDSILEGVLNTKSALGKAILGNVDGQYRINNHTYQVTKITKPDIQKFVTMYPSDREVLDEYFNKRL